MRDIKKRLEQKGWSKKDISRAVRIIEQAKANKHPKIKILDKLVFWISLAIAIIGNFIISISLIPVLLALGNLPLYAVLITLGAAFGLLFDLLIRTIEHLEAKHHLFLGIIMPIIAIITVIIIVAFSNNLEKTINIENPHNPLLAGIAYAIAFMLPYLVYQLFLKNRYQ